MEKSSQAFRTISEVSETVAVPAHVLRFWESKFTQIKPIKRGGGRRYYRPEDVQLLIAIRELLYTQGMTIRGVQKMLREQGVKSLSKRYGTPDASPDADDVVEEPDLWNDVPAEGLAEQEDDMPATPTESKPSDPARAAAMRSILTRLENLRQRMDTHPAPNTEE